MQWCQNKHYDFRYNIPTTNINECNRMNAKEGTFLLNLITASLWSLESINLRCTGKTSTLNCLCSSPTEIIFRCKHGPPLYLQRKDKRFMKFNFLWSQGVGDPEMKIADERLNPSSPGTCFQLLVTAGSRWQGACFFNLRIEEKEEIC